MTTLAQSLLFHETHGLPPAALPSALAFTRFGSNPVIDVANNPAETNEQYTPAPVELPNGDQWIYVKGADRIYAWKSTNHGLTFSLQNGGAGVLNPVAATWEGSFIVEPAAVYDRATDTIHLYYKARDSNPVNWQWGHATAPGSTPTVFTRDPANPVLTKANAQAQLGGGSTTDLSISDVIQIGSTFHFYGFAEYNGVYRLVEATGSSWNNPSGLTSLLSAGSSPFTVVQAPSVVRMPGPGPERYVMLYSAGGVQLPSPQARYIRKATLAAGGSWDFSDTTNLFSPTSGWEADEVYSASILKSTRAPFSDPIRDGSNKLVLYYSGLGSGKANVGRAVIALS